MWTDEQLVQRYLEGCPEAFDEIFNRYRSQVFQFTLRMVPERSVAEEVFQEIFLRVYRKLPEYHSQDRFRAWLFTIANRVCIDSIRKRKRERWLVFEAMEQNPAAESSVEDKMIRIQMKEKILEKLNTLDSSQKQIFLLRVHGNLLFREIAGVLKIPLNTVLVRYHQAVMAIKNSFSLEQV